MHVYQNARRYFLFTYSRAYIRNKYTSECRTLSFRPLLGAVYATSKRNLKLVHRFVVVSEDLIVSNGLYIPRYIHCVWSLIHICFFEKVLVSLLAARCTIKRHESEV